MAETSLVVFSKGMALLAEATTILDLKNVTDVGQAILRFAKRQGVSLKKCNDAAELMLGAQRGAGALLAKMAKNKGGRPSKNNRFHDETSLRDAGYTKTDSHRWQLVALVPEKEYREWLAKTREAHKQLTATDLTGRDGTGLDTTGPDATRPDPTRPDKTGRDKTRQAYFPK